jgi:divalent metal cation (Fe/Co/Zn/Cd) transporter
MQHQDYVHVTNWLGLTDNLVIAILHVVSLVGESAPPEMLQKLTYLAIRHHPQIKRVDTVRAYTFGVLYFVEVSVS